MNCNSRIRSSNFVSVLDAVLKPGTSHQGGGIFALFHCFFTFGDFFQTEKLDCCLTTRVICDSFFDLSVKAWVN